VITGDGRSAPFTPTGSWFSSRALTGVVRYVIGTPVGFGDPGTEIPENFRLEQNYPNPFNPVTNINFAIPQNEFVTLKVFDILGRETAVLISKNLTAGSYTVDFNASNLSSGIYFYRLEAGNYFDTKRMVLVK
jgi:hypothetical protein